MSNLYFCLTLIRGITTYDGQTVTTTRVQEQALQQAINDSSIQLLQCQPKNVEDSKNSLKSIVVRRASKILDRQHGDVTTH
ncbi:hypothetical protein TSUD_365830 [Trifolium subterraneum]|uniref:Uncharacterized protein n=1 Tax=Trifolium subterraneum TaxID=3900 RepID=A0A2Z6NH05_TRISU|nr:hypothetical protein TSUD_365830 [Trifolium subterraneum]